MDMLSYICLENIIQTQNMQILPWELCFIP